MGGWLNNSKRSFVDIDHNTMNSVLCRLSAYPVVALILKIMPP